jgi:hypothetical protein
MKDKEKNKVTESNKGGMGWALVGGKSSSCFYCGQRIGEYHKEDCPKFKK